MGMVTVRKIEQLSKICKILGFWLILFRYMKDDQLSSLHNQNVEEILRSSTVQTVFCYENKPE